MKGYEVADYPCERLRIGGAKAPLAPPPPVPPPLIKSGSGLGMQCRCRASEAYTQVNIPSFEILVLRHHISECKYLFYCSGLIFIFWYGCFY